MTNFAQYLKDLPKAQISGAWRKGPRITFENLKEGTGPIEHTTGIIKEGYGHPAKNPAKMAESGPPIMGFGQYRNMTMTEVKTKYGRYWDWCIENVKGFDERAKKARLY